MKLTVNERTLDYTIEYKKRKSIGLVMESHTHFRILAPHRVSQETIQKALTSKYDWLYKKSVQIEKLHRLKPSRTYTDNELYYFLGKPHILKIELATELKVPIILIENGYLCLKTSSNHPNVLRKALEVFYKRAAYEYAEPLIREYAGALGVNVNNIIIKNQKSRLGSCSSLGNINLNLKLAMMPEVVFRYIIIHEVVHRVHMNHSSAYWKLVEQLCPDYKAIEKWIKQNATAFEL